MEKEIKEEIIELIKEYNDNHEDKPNCLIISSKYYHILIEYVAKVVGERVKFTMLYGLELIVIDSKNFIKVCRREII